MPTSLRLPPFFPAVFALLYFVAQTSEAQRVCRVARGKRTPAQTSAEVRIQVTDETGGRRVITYEKVFKLNHIPARLRDRYIQHLLDSLTNLPDENEKGWTKTIEEGALPARGRLLGLNCAYNDKANGLFSRRLVFFSGRKQEIFTARS